MVNLEISHKMSSPAPEPEDIVRSNMVPNPDKGAWTHWTIVRLDLEAMTYGGLHETKEGAEAALREIISDTAIRLAEAKERLLAGGKVKEGQLAIMEKSLYGWENDADLTELEEGLPYNAHGAGIFVHGVNDGTHGGPMPEHLFQRSVLHGVEE